MWLKWTSRVPESDILAPVTITTLCQRRCWWCGRQRFSDVSKPESNELTRDDSTMDGSESWICTDNKACNERGRNYGGGIGS